MGYNVNLDLQADGYYSAKWHGCLGDYGAARGTWMVASNRVVFSPSKESGMMKDHLSALELTIVLGKVVLLPTDNRKLFDSMGVRRVTCFQRKEDIQR